MGANGNKNLDNFSSNQTNENKKNILKSKEKFQSRFDVLLKTLMEEFSAQILSYLLGIKVVSLQYLDR